MRSISIPQADDAGLADTKEKEKSERQPVGPQHVLRWFGEVATHVKTQVDKVGLVNSLAPCGVVSWGVWLCMFDKQKRKKMMAKSAVIKTAQY